MSEDPGREWEQVKLGKDISTRLSNLYRESTDWRSRAGYEKNDAAHRQQRVFNNQIHTYGRHVLQMRTIDDFEGDELQTDQMVKAGIQAGVEARGRLKRRKVRVSDMEDGDNNISLKLDKEWSTYCVLCSSFLLLL